MLHVIVTCLCIVFSWVCAKKKAAAFMRVPSCWLVSCNDLMANSLAVM